MKTENMQIGAMYRYVHDMNLAIWKDATSTDGTKDLRAGTLMTNDVFQLIETNHSFKDDGYETMLILCGLSLGWIDVWVGNNTFSVSHYFEELTATNNG